MSSVEERLGALESAGWTLVENRPGRFERREGRKVRVVAASVILERYFNATRVQESSENSIEEALTRAELQQKRLEEIERAENRAGVRAGLVNEED